MPRPLLLLLLVSLLFASAALAGDVTVTHISRLPEMDYVWGSSNPTREGWPAAGQQIVWRANVKSFGSGELTRGYHWLEDGREIAHGTATLAPNATTPVDLPWTWSFERHRLAFEVDAAGDEESLTNNRLEIFTDALGVGFWVEQSFYDYFRRNQGNLGIGSTCWENWAQRLIAFYNDMAANALYPDTPDGVRDRWRLQKIIVVPDNALPLTPPVQVQRGREPGGAAAHPDDTDRSVDLVWGFRAATAGAYGDTHTATPANPFYVAPVFLHELGHARYLTDVYGFDLHHQPPAFEIDVTDGGKPIVWNILLGGQNPYLVPEQGLMNRDFTYIDRYSAMALNMIAGARATRGNYNDPENVGSFLNDLPAENRVTLRDAAGAPLANADVEIFQSALGHYDEWYATYYDDVADLKLRTDEHGRVFVGRCPFSSDGVVVNYWRGSNTVVIVRAKKAGAWLYGFLDSRAFNLEYWRGNTRLADYELTVGGEQCTPNGPTILAPAWDAKGLSGDVALSWVGVDGATSYRVVAAIDGVPRVVATTASTSAAVRLGGSVYWWVEADRAACSTVRSSTSHVVVTPAPRRRAAGR